VVFFREESVRMPFLDSLLGEKTHVEFQFRVCVFIYEILSVMPVSSKFLRLCHSFAVVAGDVSNDEYQ